MSNARKAYPLSAQFWRHEGAIIVYDCDQNRLCTIPTGSLASSGDLNWDFVVYCIRACVEEDGFVCAFGERDALDLNQDVTSGRYFFRRGDSPMQPCTLRRGPIGKQRGRVVGERSVGSRSTMSDSKRSSANQQSLRIGVIARDGRCLITEKPYNLCTGSHIVPFSRPDIYAELLGYEDEWLFETWMGLLLEDGIHKCFDRYEISIYPRGDQEWVVHVFYSPDRSLFEYHGKRFDSSRFQLPRPFWPSRDLLLWHHLQGGEQMSFV
ncbi:hypothetical protein FA10DRAFT_282151 [Acaromyces ingoldii]|uniref:HNH nuclease domain-containing protein n=1 Tax=Acaromyces ingoldii TaxID=215250 RepID=A0A316YCW2_9BASI|nr:hypothetical protein FA10DRAFT_282151 [Acaromyces ingoldii]PWN86694.1 hypothetical protein FA10DRAFT_282151 [Acaromyces ingoldii]